MRYVIVTDSHGYKRRVQVRDQDGDEMANKTGIPAGPPDLRSGIDWDSMMRQTNNLFTESNIFSWSDLQKKPAILNAALSIYKRYLVDMFRQEERASLKVTRETKARKFAK